MLAGGAGRRMGGNKATVQLGGRPLITWPLAALRATFDDVVVVAKADTVLPPDLGVPTWLEPAEPRHPLAGLLHALRCANGRAIVVCAVDLPAVTAATMGRLADAASKDAAVAVDADGRPQPLLARYPVKAAEAFAAAPPDARLTEVVLGLDPILVPVPAAELINVNTLEDLAAAERI